MPRNALIVYLRLIRQIRLYLYILKLHVLSVSIYFYCVLYFYSFIMCFVSVFVSLAIFVNVFMPNKIL